MNRPSGRAADQMRSVSFERHFTKHAAGSVLTSFGDTRVLCTASVESGVPPFLRGKGQGWITAEYGMLPGSTNTRVSREAVRGKQDGRTVEIQRLIGRCLRGMVDLSRVGEYTIRLDCDVLQADGGTRTASVSGAAVALTDALRSVGAESAVQARVAAVSVGMFEGVAVLDLDYAEDSRAETDMNVAGLQHGGLIEVQGTAEGQAFSRDDLGAMTDLAEKGIAEIFAEQARALDESDS